MQTPEEIELDLKKAELSQLESTLVERELELATFIAKVNAFESLYLERVGVIYVELDAIEAEIAAILAAASPQESSVQAKAREAAQRAEASKSELERSQRKPPPRFEKADDLVKLFRTAARALHPDLTTDESEKQRRRAAMALVNEAYENHDIEAIQRILDGWKASPDNISGSGVAAELVRSIRRLYQVRIRLEEIEKLFGEMRSRDAFQLYQRHEEAMAREVDLLGVLAAAASVEVANAKERLRALRDEVSK